VERIRALLPPGGYANAVGVWLAALDNGLEELKLRARRIPAEGLRAKPAPNVRSPAEVLLHAAEVEARRAGAVADAPPPPPPAPPPDASLERLLEHLDAVRKRTAALLRPLVERDLDTLRTVPGVEGKTTVRRMLAELLEHQAHHRGQLGLLARLVASPEGVR
jgi:uncharacterized damage-inducible protein DinB